MRFAGTDWVKVRPETCTAPRYRTSFGPVLVSGRREAAARVVQAERCRRPTMPGAEGRPSNHERRPRNTNPRRRAPALVGSTEFSEPRSAVLGNLLMATAARWWLWPFPGEFQWHGREGGPEERRDPRAARPVVRCLVVLTVEPPPGRIPEQPAAHSTRRRQGWR